MPNSPSPYGTVSPMVQVGYMSTLQEKANSWWVYRHIAMERDPEQKSVDTTPVGKRGSGSTAGQTGKLVVLDWDEWAEKKVPPREMLLAPIIPQKALVELYSERGVGKTFLALSLAAAIATGSPLLRWSVDKPRRVLYVDGEMAFADLQERMRAIVAGIGVPPEPDYLRLLAADLQEHGVPDLAADDGAGRRAIDRALRLGTPEQVDLLILDNLSTLTATGSENSDEAWAVMQDWLLRLRRHGVSVLFVHHAGKGGKQRGTSKREDALDTVIMLKKPKGHDPADGLRFEAHFEKHRGFFGSDAHPFAAQYAVENGVGSWSAEPLGREAQMLQVLSLTERGMSTREIADETGISKSTVGRLLKDARGRGLLGTAELHPGTATWDTRRPH